MEANKDDEREILYIALSNSLILYKQSLEENKLSEDERELTEYLIKRHLELLDKYSESILQEDNKENKPIERPSW